MVKTLENIASGLKTKKDGRVIVNPNYNSEIFGNTYEFLNELSNADVTTTEGLKSYQSLTGYDPSNVSRERVDVTRKQSIKGSQNDLFKYTAKHFGKVVKDLDEEDHLKLAFSYCPFTDLRGKGSEKYNFVKNTIQNVREKLGKIERNPQAFLAEMVNGVSDLLKPYFFIDEEESLQVARMDAQAPAEYALRDFGSQRFLITTQNHLENLSNEFPKKERELVEKMRPDRVLNAVELAEHESKYKKYQEALNEIRADTQIIPQLIGETIKYITMATLKKQRENQSNEQKKQ